MRLFQTRNNLWGVCFETVSRPTQTKSGSEYDQLGYTNSGSEYDQFDYKSGRDYNQLGYTKSWQ